MPIVSHIRTFHPRRSRPSTSATFALQNYLDEFLMPPGVWDFQSIYPHHQVILEIGSGMGEAALEFAQKNPDVLLICVEVHTPGVGSLIAKAKESGLPNIRVVVRDAIEVLKDCVPSESLDELRIWFPDPWRKTKHQNRRIISDQFLGLFINKLKVGGRIHTITDWEHYGKQMALVLAQDSRIDCVELVARPNWRPITKFERRGIADGRPIREFIASKKPAN